MGLVLHVSCLQLHTLQHHLLNVSISHRRYEEQRMQGSEVPRFELLPHLVHRLWAERDKVWESIMEEEDLMLAGVTCEVEARLSLLCYVSQTVG